MEQNALRYIGLILLLNFSVLLVQVINRLSLGVEFSQLLYLTPHKELNLLFMFPVIAFVIVMIPARLKSKFKSVGESYIFSGIALIMGVFTLFTAGLGWFGGDDFAWGTIVFFTSALFIFGLIITMISNNSSVRKRLAQSVEV